MGLAGRIKPVSYLKAHAAEMLRTLAEDRAPVIITQNGEGRAVLLDIASWEETQETLALFALHALGKEDVAAGRVSPAEDVIARLRARRYDDE